MMELVVHMQNKALLAISLKADGAKKRGFHLRALLFSNGFSASSSSIRPTELQDWLEAATACHFVKRSFSAQTDKQAAGRDSEASPTATNGCWCAHFFCNNADSNGATEDWAEGRKAKTLRVGSSSKLGTRFIYRPQIQDVLFDRTPKFLQKSTNIGKNRTQILLLQNFLSIIFHQLRLFSTNFVKIKATFCFVINAISRQIGLW